MSSHAPVAQTVAPASTTASTPTKKGWSFNIGLAISLVSLAVVLFIAYTVAEKKGWIEGAYSELRHPTGTREREVREAIIKRQEIETKSIPERIINNGDDSAINEFNTASDRESERLKKLDRHHNNSVPQTWPPKVLDWVAPLEQKTEDSDNGNYRVTVNPTILWPDTKLSLVGHNTIHITASGRMCSPPSPCVGPEGLTNVGFARFDTTTSKPYIYGDAIYNELIGRFDNGQPFRVGKEKEISIPAGATTVSFMPNIRECYLNEAGGGWVLQVTIQ